MQLNLNVLEMIDVLDKTKDKVFASVDSMFLKVTSLDLTGQLFLAIKKLQQNDVSMLGEIREHFLSGGSYHELAIENDWVNEYLKLSTDFEHRYNSIINLQPGNASSD